MSRYLSDFFKLKQPLTCVECKTIFLQIPEESFDEAPVHCRECGAYICNWSSVKEVCSPDNSEYGTSNSSDLRKLARTRL